ncbi:MAG: heavy-metal-associated domain-containing protein [Nanoarchaeota archaeon]|nr:heavy-metal-associated domain-containing protein [Nanoarchaeota archaeon]
MKKKLTISGMHCASCAANVERSLKKINGVKSASVSLLTKKGFVESDEDISDDEIRKAVARTGYRLEKIEGE